MNGDNNQASNSTPTDPIPGTGLPAAHENKIAAILAYLGPLSIVAYFMAGADSFAKFHVKQGLVLFILELIIWVLLRTMMFMFLMLMPIIWLLDLALLVLSIIGIMNVINNQQKQLPVVGKFAKYFTF